MSTEKLEKYKSLYDDFIKNFVELHNSHTQFLQTLGREPAYVVRRCLRNMRDLSTELRLQCFQVTEENKKNIKEQKKLQSNKKGKKNGQHNHTTTKTV